MLIAGEPAVSLDNASLYASLERKVAARTEALAQADQRLERLSFTDALTGLANRRRLEEVLDDEWHRAQHSRTSLAVAMVDVDRFKRCNDHFGHLAGDECLRRVAKVLGNTVHDVDLGARYGGQEFAIVMLEADIWAARQLAHRMLATVGDGALAGQARRTQPGDRCWHGLTECPRGLRERRPRRKSARMALAAASNATS
jgi:diguanylate cyclase (GGDEF)-like protein